MSQSFTFPAPAELINANSRMHWRKKARLTKEWRAAGLAYATRERLERLRGQRAHITVTIGWTTRHHRDPANYADTAKALVDGIVGDYGLLPNDSSTWLDGPDMRGGYDPDSTDVPMVTVTIEALS